MQMIARTGVQVSRVVSELDLEGDAWQVGHLIVHSIGAVTWKGKR